MNPIPESALRYEGGGLVSGTVAQATVTVGGAAAIETEHHDAETITPHGRRLSGVTGSFQVRGENLRLMVEGSDLDVMAIGDGKAEMRGNCRLRQMRPRPESVRFRRRRLHSLASCAG